MNNNTRIVFIIFYIFRHYKRLGETSKRNQLLNDLKKCKILLERMKNKIDPMISENIVRDLINRINRFGANIKLQYPLVYSDSYDLEIIMIMLDLIDQIIGFVKSPVYRRYSGEIFTRFLALHILPRVLLDDSSGDSSTLQKFHISKQEALEYVEIHLGYNTKNLQKGQFFG